jgi:hypothetical protein
MPPNPIGQSVQTCSASAVRLNRAFHNSCPQIHHDDASSFHLNLYIGPLLDLATVSYKFRHGMGELCYFSYYVIAIESSPLGYRSCMFRVSVPQDTHKHMHVSLEVQPARAMP